MDKIKNIRSVHEISKQIQVTNPDCHIKGYTDFGIYIEKEKMQDFFTNDAKQSKIFLDYNLFDSDFDQYKTDYINVNCIKLPIVYISRFLSVLSINNVNQQYYDRLEEMNSKQQSHYIFEYLSAYSCVNLMNDLTKKNNKHVLLLAQTESFIKHLESIIYYAYEICKVDFNCQFFVIDTIESQNIYLKKYKFQNNRLIVENRGKRKIANYNQLQGYIICALQNQECMILYPQDYEELKYCTSRDKLKPQSVKGFHKIHNYQQNDYQNFRDIVQFFSKIRFHNDNISAEIFEICAKYITEIPKFPNSLKIKKKDMDQLTQKMIDLNLNQSDEERIVKNYKKVKKATTKKKDSFINDSSEDSYEIDDVEQEEWLPKTRSQCRKVVKKDKITPTKKQIFYNNLIENHKCTRKKNSKQKIQTHQYPTPTEFSIHTKEKKLKPEDKIHAEEDDQIL